jgi:hypothetical protein
MVPSFIKPLRLGNIFEVPTAARFEEKQYKAKSGLSNERVCQQTVLL